MAEEVKKKCVIICASPYNQPDFIRDIIGVNDYVICADGGFDTALKAGIKPDIVIGDFDSKENFLDFIDSYNEKVKNDGLEDREINYTDTTGILMSSVKKVVNSVSYVLMHILRKVWNFKRV